MSFFLCMVFARILNGEPSSYWESLEDIYRTYDEAPGLHHFYEYGKSYDENIHHLRENAAMRGEKVKMLEIGVQSGGSARVWKRYFRGTLSYVGADKDRKCKIFESPEENILIEIGSQLNIAFLTHLCTTYGPFDLIIDDGGHTNRMILTSLRILWQCMSDKGVYAIEDLHALNMGTTFLKEGEVTVFQTLAEWMRLRSPSPGLRINKTNSTPLHLAKLSFTSGLIFLHYTSELSKITPFKEGTYWTYEKPLEPVTWCSGCYEDIPAH